MIPSPYPSYTEDLARSQCATILEDLGYPALARVTLDKSYQHKCFTQKYFRLLLESDSGMESTQIKTLLARGLELAEKAEI